MKCARCSAEVPRQSQFCLRCGTPINAAANYAPPVAQRAPMPATPNNQRPLYAIIGLLAVAVLAMVGWMVKSSLAQKPGDTHAVGLVQAPNTSAPGPLIQAPADTKPLTPIVAPPTQPVQQPNNSDIEDYLAFLKRVEMAKENLIHDQKRDMSVFKDMQGVEEMKKYMDFENGGAGGKTDPADPKNNIQKLSKTTGQIGDDWNRLTRLFIAKTPPQACIDLHDKYYTHLSTSQKMIMQVYDLFVQAQNDPQEALKGAYDMQGKTAQYTSDMKMADTALGDVCRTYHLTKDFEVGEGSGGNLFSQ